MTLHTCIKVVFPDPAIPRHTIQVGFLSPAVAAELGIDGREAAACSLVLEESIPSAIVIRNYTNYFSFI